MKKLILIAALILAANFSFGQTLQKGNLVGIHIMTVTLNPNVTLEQFTSFFNSRVIPEYAKQFDVKGYLVKSIRGDNENSFGFIWLFKTEQDRDKFFNADGTESDLGKSISEKVKPVDEELKKLGTYTTKYTDWIVQ